MTFFEYMMVMVSLIMALALSHIMRASAEFLSSPKRYWVQSSWAAIIVLLILQSWWAYWDLRDISDWSFLKYLSVFFYPLFFSFIASILIPLNRTVGHDWRASFFNKRIWFFWAMLASSFIAILHTWLVMGSPLFHPYRIFQLTLIFILLVGLIGKTPRTQAFVVIAYVVVELAANIFARTELGALAPG